MLSQAIPSNLIKIPGFRIFRQDREYVNPENNQAKKGGGICLFISEAVKGTVRVLDKLNMCNNDIECQWLELKLPTQRNVIICNTYRPPQGNVTNFLDHIELCLEQIDYIRKDVFIMGDTNIDVLDKKLLAAKELKEFLSQTGLINCIKTPTRFSSQRNSCLDHIYTNSGIINECDTLDVNLSDHLAVFVNRKKQKPLNEKTNFNGRSYRNYDTDIFAESLSRQNWNLFDSETDPNALWSIYKNNVLNVLSIMCPIKQFSIKKYKEPWITNELLELIKDKDSALRKAKKSKTKRDWNHAKRLRNECLSKVRKAKCDFVKNELNNNMNDSRKFWRNLHDVWPNKKSNSTKITLIDQTTKNEIAQEDTATYINKYFTGIGPTLSHNLHESWEYEGITADRHLSNIIVNPEEIVKNCKEIDIHKSSSVEGISSKVLRDAFLVQNDRLCYLIRHIFSLGIYPMDWKIANIIPLQKDGNVHNVNNLRPISLLPLPSKLIEKVIHDRMLHHLETNHYLDIKQGGFRKNNSTINTITYFTNDIFNSMNKKELTIATYIDMAKAFDTVNHEILLKKLQKLGFTGNLLKLLQNYLTNRRQSTSANGYVSELENITCGIPQGSTVGPLMYIIYVNDIISSIKSCKYYLYADDTVIYTSGNLDLCTQRITEDLSLFKLWCNRNKLTLNVKKTKYTIFGLKSKTKRIFDHSLFIDNIKIDRVHSYKYLGITLDMNLSFNRHLENLIKTISYKALLLAKIRKYITQEVALQIYKTMILPIMEYGDILYDGSNQKLTGKLQVLQNRCLRTCLLPNQHLPTIRLHEIGSIANLKMRREMHLQLYMFKQKSNVNIVNNRKVCTRMHDAIVFTTFKPNSEKYKRNVLYKGALAWNSLSVAIRKSQTYTLLKDLLNANLVRNIVPVRRE